ncbi:hypothetical protein DPMN_019639 [Dreissena polymorpha]|uniref:Uncharacterized protein n=1 Tax=Dreissena polymorpha TaxID=45954 RepID=A0A9D4NL63_DREPO|nr:hypothetical protein DPMN_019639 [Dreissena polymorpha]
MSGFGMRTKHSKPRRPRIELMQEKALKNISSFVVWSSTPFDSQPEESRTQTRLLAISARPACHLRFLTFSELY